MNLREIKDLINLMNEHALSEIEIESEGVKIMLKKTTAGASVETAPSSAPSAQAVRVPDPAGEKAPAEKPGQVIQSPMVGTFYAAPAPDAEPYVKPGSKIEVGQVICVIEAMKLMNEIKSEIRGVLSEIKVANGDPVEFGQPLFVVH